MIPVLFFSSGLVVWGRPHVVTFIGHARRELLPPSPSQWSEIKEGANKALATMKSGRWMQKTTREGFQSVLVGLEIGCWFFVGEIIGRRSIVGYKV